MDTSWMQRIVVNMCNGNDSFIDCLSMEEALQEIERLHMRENKAIKSFYIQPLTIEQWKIEQGL